MAARAWVGIARSLALYRMRPAHGAGLRALYADFVGPGDLVFDVGAHVGDRTAAFRALGARVVAVEPQRRLAMTLRLIHGRDRDVIVRRTALGAAEGTADLRVNSANPTVATLSEDFLAATSGATGWEGQVWDGAETVPVTTLDALIAAHGAPSFVKIDVEGHEPDVLAGLAAPPPALSFECVTAARAAAQSALARARALGYRRFRLSLGESHVWTDDWTDGEGMRSAIAALPEAANSGDVYCRL